MQKASISINRTQCACVFMRIHSNALSLTGTYHTASLGSSCSRREKTDRGVWQMTTALFRWEMSRLWPSECPRHADTQCGVRHVTGGEAHGVEPETSTGKWQAHFQTTLTVKKIKNWQWRPATERFLRLMLLLEGLQFRFLSSDLVPTVVVQVLPNIKEKNSVVLFWFMSH